MRLEGVKKSARIRFPHGILNSDMSAEDRIYKWLGAGEGARTAFRDSDLLLWQAFSPSPQRGEVGRGEMPLCQSTFYTNIFDKERYNGLLDESWTES
jgi:hypothetical protein